MKTLFIVIALLNSPKEEAVVFNHLYNNCDVAIYKLKQKYDYIQNLHITITNKNDFPIQEKYKNLNILKFDISDHKNIFQFVEDCNKIFSNKSPEIALRFGTIGSAVVFVVMSYFLLDV